MTGQYVTLTRYFRTTVPSALTGTVNCAAHAAVLLHGCDDCSMCQVAAIGSFTSTVTGIGLWLRKRWGEWLTVIITGSLIPIEIYETYWHPSWVKAVVLAVNVAIVLYLIYHIRSERPE